MWLNAENGQSSNPPMQIMMAVADTRIDLATHEGKYPTLLINKGVRTQDKEYVRHVIEETKTKIIVDGHFDYRLAVPKERIIGRPQRDSWDVVQ